MNFFKNLKKKTWARPSARQGGMTYVELIVVLSIFSIMSSTIIFNYGEFQTKIDIKNLANDIALKFVEAQKSANSGRIPPVLPQVSPWKPSYGVFLDIDEHPANFVYFTDLNQNTFFPPIDLSADGNSCLGDECLDVIRITKGNFISKIFVIANNGSETELSSGNKKVHVTFTRPGSSATIKCNICSENTNGIRILVSSPENITSSIKVYASGRIQIN